MSTYLYFYFCMFNSLSHLISCIILIDTPHIYIKHENMASANLVFSRLADNVGVRSYFQPIFFFNVGGRI